MRQNNFLLPLEEGLGKLAVLEHAGVWRRVLKKTLQKVVFDVSYDKNYVNFCVLRRSRYKSKTLKITLVITLLSTLRACSGFGFEAKASKFYFI
jgi:hypothetical protein